MRPYNNIDPYKIAEAFKLQIKETIAVEYSVPADDLMLLLDNKEGAYLSQEDPGAFCCFVVGKKNGFLYLVSGKIEKNGENLTNLKAGIVS